MELEGISTDQYICTSLTMNVLMTPQWHAYSPESETRPSGNNKHFQIS